MATTLPFHAAAGATASAKATTTTPSFFSRLLAAMIELRRRSVERELRRHAALFGDNSVLANVLDDTKADNAARKLGI